MQKNKTVIISPSGSFYGSEQVLYDFLTATTNVYDVYVKDEGRLFSRLKQENTRHIVRSYTSLYSLYFRVFIALLFNKYNSVYVNEGGHARWLSVVARIIFWKKYLLHIRISEDATKARLQYCPANITLISVSEYISDIIYKELGIIPVTIHDLYNPTNASANWHFTNSKQTLKIGVIGRVTKTKGIDLINEFYNYLKDNHIVRFEFHFFGDIDTIATPFIQNMSDGSILTKFEGFVTDKNEIYNSIDLILHFNRNEPLGRIFFESLDYSVPIVGFNASGIGEIAKVLGVDSQMVNVSDSWVEDMCDKIEHINLSEYKEARQNISKYFSPEHYVSKIEALL